MAPTDIIAWIIIILSAIKIVVLLVNPKSWLGFAKRVYSKPTLVKVVSFVLAAVVLLYLLQELTFVQIIAVVGFTFLLMLFGLASHIHEVIGKFESQIKKGQVFRENWFYALVWIALLLLALFELLS